EKGGACIGEKLRVIIRRGHIGGLLDTNAPSIGEIDVDAAKALASQCRNPVMGIEVGNIAGETYGPLSEFSDGGIHCLGAAPNQQHLRSLRDESAGSRADDQEVVSEADAAGIP